MKGTKTIMADQHALPMDDRRLDELLDDALKDSFPASDAVSIVLSRYEGSR